MNNWLSRIPNTYLAYCALAVWGALGIMLLHKTSYGIDEGAAQALLLVWSVADDVVSPIVTLGLPDFRTIFLVPAGVLWTGNVVAAKIAAMVIMSIAAWSLHAWRHRAGDAEGALIATGLLLISPLMLNQLDTISVAAFLLITFALGTWSDTIYRESTRAFGGMYFFQLFLCLVAVTLHPIGLAYPLALLWTWYRDPIDQKHRNYYFMGIGGALLMALALTSGWSHVEWFANPVRSLSALVLGHAEPEAFGTFHWVSGILMSGLLLFVLFKQANNLWADFLGRILLAALAIGMLVGDEIFAVVALVTCLYWGFPLLFPEQNAQGGFWRQRGVALLLLVLISTTFIAVDRANYQALSTEQLSARDSLIKTLAEDSTLFLKEEPATQSDTPKKRARVASQWPALTMLACRCDVLPLPPPAKDSDALFAMLRGVDYLVFNPRDLANGDLSHNLAAMDSGKAETIGLQQGGVIIQVKNPAPAQLAGKPI